MRAPRLLLLLIGLAVPLAGCGDEGGLDRSDPQAVFRAAMRALYDADWDGLSALLTKDARFTLEHDMRRLQQNLASPRPGSELHRRVREVLGERYEAEVAAAVDGGLPAVLRFYVHTWPREREPAIRQLRADALSRSFFYEAPDGVLRPIKLIQVRGRWTVQELHL